jgi:hypothetical protein
MPDDPKERAQDRKRISLKEDYELRYWSERFGVSREELREAVSAAGSDPEKVGAHIRANKGR